MKPSIIGFEIASRCLISQGPRVAPTFAVLVPFSMRERFSRTLRGGSISSKKEMGRESFSWTSGT